VGSGKRFVVLLHMAAVKVSQTKVAAYLNGKDPLTPLIGKDFLIFLVTSFTFDNFWLHSSLITIKQAVVTSS
jgi:hypothetical protein